MSEIFIYENADGQSAVQVRLDGETVWLTQKKMADLFESSTDNIGLHLKNIYANILGSILFDFPQRGLLGSFLYPCVTVLPEKLLLPLLLLHPPQSPLCNE